MNFEFSRAETEPGPTTAVERVRVRKDWNKVGDKCAGTTNRVCVVIEEEDKWPRLWTSHPGTHLLRRRQQKTVRPKLRLPVPMHKQKLESACVLPPVRTGKWVKYSFVQRWTANQYTYESQTASRADDGDKESLKMTSTGQEMVNAESKVGKSGAPETTGARTTGAGEECDVQTPTGEEICPDPLEESLPTMPANDNNNNNKTSGGNHDIVALAAAVIAEDPDDVFLHGPRPGEMGGHAGTWNPDESDRLEEHVLDLVHDLADRSVGREVPLADILQTCDERGYDRPLVMGCLDCCYSDDALRLNHTRGTVKVPIGTFFPHEDKDDYHDNTLPDHDRTHDRGPTTGGGVRGKGNRPERGQASPRMGDGSPRSTGLTMLVPNLECRETLPDSPTGARTDGGREERRTLRWWDTPDRPTPKGTPMTTKEPAHEPRGGVSQAGGRTVDHADDLLGRFLANRETAEDCVVAETSQILQQSEIDNRVKDREAELRFSCGGTLDVTGPDTTSTPRPNRDYSTPVGCSRGDKTAAGPADDESPPQLRADHIKEKSLRDESWGDDLDTDSEEAGKGQDQEVQHSGGLNVDPAGLDKLASSLQRSFTDGKQSNHTTPRGASTPKEGGSPYIIRDDDVEMQPVNTSSGSQSRKRGRGGKKHRKGDAESVNSHDVGPKQAKKGEEHDTGLAPSQDKQDTSPRGRGRPAGSTNRKYSKQRSSSRQRGLRPENAGLLGKSAEADGRGGPGPQAGPSSGSHRAGTGHKDQGGTSGPACEDEEGLLDDSILD